MAYFIHGVPYCMECDDTMDRGWDDLTKMVCRDCWENPICSICVEDVDHRALCGSAECACPQNHERCNLCSHEPELEVLLRDKYHLVLADLRRECQERRPPEP